jgi:hypothetical protein
MRALAATVVTPAADRDLITLADLREQLQFSPNNTADDAWLIKVIGRTSRQAERYCDRIFQPQDYRETFRGGVTGNDGEPLILAQAPVDDTSLVVSVDGAALDVAGYVLSSFPGLVYRVGDSQRWTSGTSIVAAYTAGFDIIPDDVQQAVLQLCVVEVAGRGRDPMLRADESGGARREYWIGGVPGSTAIPQDIAGLLNPYRRGLVG